MQCSHWKPSRLSVEGKRVLVIGGGEARLGKPIWLRQPAPRVEIFTSSPCARVKEIAETRSNVFSPVCVLCTLRILPTQTLASGATFDDAEADHARKIADEAGVPLNSALTALR